MTLSTSIYIGSPDWQKKHEGMGGSNKVGEGIQYRQRVRARSPYAGGTMAFMQGWPMSHQYLAKMRR